MSYLRWNPLPAENESFFIHPDDNHGNNTTSPLLAPELTATTSNRSSFVYVGASSILYDYPEIAIPTLLTYSMTFTLGVTGNALIIVAVFRYCCLKTATNYLSMSLAVADLLVSAICVPFKAAEFFLSAWPLGGVMCKLLYYIRTVTKMASILTLTTISLERWYVVIRPMQARSVCTPGWACRVIACVWVLSLSLSTPTLYGQDLVGYKWPVGDVVYHCQQKWPQTSFHEIFSIYFATLTLLPMAIVFVAYSSTIYKLWFSTQFNIRRDFDSGQCNICSHGLPREHFRLSPTQPRAERTPISADKTRTTPITAEAVVTPDNNEMDITSASTVRKKPSRFLFDKETVEIFSGQDKDAITACAKVTAPKNSGEAREIKSAPITSLSPRNMRVRVHGTVSNYQEIIRERKQVVRMMVVVFLLFLVCWGPQVVLNLLITFGAANPYTKDVYAMRIAFRLMSYLNSCLNPLCYNLMSSKFRSSFKRLLPCCFKWS